MKNKGLKKVALTLLVLLSIFMISSCIEEITPPKQPMTLLEELQQLAAQELKDTEGKREDSEDVLGGLYLLFDGTIFYYSYEDIMLLNHETEAYTLFFQRFVNSISPGSFIVKSSDREVASIGDYFDKGSIGKVLAESSLNKGSPAFTHFIQNDTMVQRMDDTLWRADGKTEPGPQRTITLNASPTNGGNVSFDNSTWTSSASQTQDEGTNVAIYAQATVGYSFNGWYDAETLISTDSSHTVTLNTNKTLEARFEEQIYTLTLQASPTEGGIVTGAGTYTSQQQMVITATATEGYLFVNWTQEATIVSTQATFIYTMPGTNVTLTAHFEAVVSPNWIFNTGSFVNSSPAIGSDGTIYVGSYDSYLYAITPEGSQSWAFKTNSGIASSPAIGSDGTIYVGSGDCNLYAIDADTGTELWKYGTGDAIYSSPAIGNDGTIYIGSWDKKLYAINLDGTKKWEYETGDWVESSPAIGNDGTIYVGSRDKKLYAINPDGTEKWSFSTDGSISSSPAIGNDGTIYIGSWDKKLYAINPDGTEKWKYETGEMIHYTSPAIGSDGTIYVGSDDKKLHAINPDGSKTWEYVTEDKILSSPAIGNDGTIYVGSDDKKLHAINPDGSKTWEYVTGNKIFSSPAIGNDGTIYVGSMDYNLYAISTNCGGLMVSDWPKFRQNSHNTGRDETTTQRRTITLNASPTNRGSVSFDNSTWTSSASQTQDEGTNVAIYAQATVGYSFNGWYDAETLISTDNSHTVTLNTNKTLEARFEEQLYTLTLQASPTEGGTVTGEGSYEESESVQITATSNEGYFFVSWTENDEVISQDAEHTYIMPPQNTTLIANFATVPEMVNVNRGTFQMGDERGDLWHTTRPVHSVSLTYDFWIGKYQVTFAEYDIFCDATGRSKRQDEGWGRGSRPVININWWDAIAYCNWLSDRNGLAVAYDSEGNLLNRDGQITEDITQVEGYRLPTEAEWEYAASGGHQALPIPPRFLYAGSDDINEVAWYASNSEGTTHPVGGKDANELGLHDMSGNVWEWCHDWYGNYTSSAKTNPIGPSSDSNRIIRGSTWSQYTVNWCRVAYRTSSSPSTRNNGQGFRLSRIDGINKAMITAESSPTAAGNVRINSGDWSTHQQVTVDIGSQVTMEALANEGYEWEGWYEGDTKISDQASYSFDASDQNRSLIASFQAAIPGDPATIRSKAFPNFGGMVGIDDDQDLSVEFEKDDIPAGQNVTLYAQPHDGWVFEGWWETGADSEDDPQPLSTETNWVYKPDEDIDLIALFDPNIDGESQWDFQATLTIESIPWEDLEEPFEYGTSGSGTVTITQDPVRMVGSATFPVPNLSSISESAVRSVLAYGLRRTLAKVFPALAPAPSRERVDIPPENTIRIRGPEDGEYIMDYDVTFHNFDPEDPYDSSLTPALAQYQLEEESYFLVVEIDPNSLDPQEVEFRVNLLYVTDEEQEKQEEITGHLDCIVRPQQASRKNKKD